MLLLLQILLAYDSIQIHAGSEALKMMVIMAVTEQAAVVTMMAMMIWIMIIIVVPVVEHFEWQVMMVPVLYSEAKLLLWLEMRFEMRLEFP
jgi:hypothetical protein